jgi:anti-sigma regulatory factor (Ser/Thr protein kinase)
MEIKIINELKIKLNNINDEIKIHEKQIRVLRESIRNLMKRKKYSKNKMKELKCLLNESYKNKSIASNKRNQINGQINYLFKKINKNKCPIRDNYTISIRKKGDDCSDIVKQRKNECKDHNLFKKIRCGNEKRGNKLRNQLDINLFDNNNKKASHKTIKDFIIEFQNKLLEMNGTVNNKCFSYNAQIYFTDIFYFIITKIVNNSSNVEAVQNLKNKNISYVTEQAIYKKRTGIDIKFFKLYYDHLLQYITDDLGRFIKSKFDKIINATDGTRMNFFKCLTKNNFTIDKNKRYCTGLVNAIYNITNGLPTDVLLTENMSEQEALKSQIKYLEPDSILLGDAHYFSYDIINELSEKKINYIFKISKSFNIIKEFLKINEMSTIVDFYEHKIRLIKNISGKNVKIIGTNLLDEKYTDKIILELYDQRWFIEEFYKIMKCKLNMKQLKSLNLDNILQEIYVQNIIVLISRYIELVGTHYSKLITDNYNKKVNNSNLIFNVSNELLYLLLYKNINKKKLKKILNLIFDLINTYVIIIDNLHNVRIRNRPVNQFVNNGYIDNG